MNKNDSLNSTFTVIYMNKLQVKKIELYRGDNLGI